jgi:hypothetical protein
MMDFIMVPTIIGIIVLGFYKLFELFVCRKERLLMIEKMGDKFLPEMAGNKINFSPLSNLSFSALKFGCLFMGLGLGLLVAFFIHCNLGEFCDSRRIQSVLYGSCVLLFGGLGLLIAFLVELKINKK